MRKVDGPGDLGGAIEACRREALGPFGDPTLFIEQAVVDPRHIEVQVLADSAGQVIHLYERDCSVQRRHQKVVEIAPAPLLETSLRDAMCSDAVRFTSEIEFVGAGTVEFLLGTDGRYAFIEMNPRIQVEHTVTEEVTDIDLVVAQMRIAGGATLADLGWSQESVRVRGAALQCRITTEDPANDFRPDTGVITTYRSPGGGGVRMDGGTTYTGAEVSAHFDSLLVKLTCRGRTFELALQKARRALGEFRISGVTTNIAFLQALLADPDFSEGRLSMAFIDAHPHILAARGPADRGTKLLHYLADVTVNRPWGEAPVAIDPADKLPPLDFSSPAPPGSRQRLLDLGPEEFARQLRVQDRVGVTDTTFRDAHQSLLATRVRTRDLVIGAQHVSRLTSQLLSIECWGGERPMTWRCASSARTLGRGWVRCGPQRRMSACRCCCAAATPWATPPTPNRSPSVSCRRRWRPGWTSSEFLTHSTMSSRCAQPSTRCARLALPWRRWRGATPVISPIRGRRYTHSITICGWPSGWSTLAPTSSRSKTWRDSCEHLRPDGW